MDNSNALTPEELSELEALELRKLMARKAAAQSQKKPGRVEAALTAVSKARRNFGEGAGLPFAEAYYGGKELLGMEGEQDQEKLSELRSAARDSTAGKVGEFTGEMAQFMVPGGAGLKAARALTLANKAAKTRKLVPLASDVAGVAGIEALKAPDEGVTRGEAAASGATAALGGAVLGKALQGAGGLRRVWREGARGTPKMQEYIAKGYRPTPGEVVPAFNRAEQILRRFPSFSRGLRRMDMETEQSMNLLAFKEAAPPTPASVRRSVRGQKANLKPVEVNDIGQMGTRKLKKAFDAAYKAASPKLRDLDPTPLMDALVNAGQTMRVLGKGERAAAERALGDVLKWVNKAPDKSTRDIEKALKKVLQRKDASQDLLDTIQPVIQSLRSGLPAPHQKVLGEIDKQYGKYVVLNKATGRGEAPMTPVIDPADLRRYQLNERGAPNTGMFTLHDLNSANIGANLTKRGSGLGKAPMQDFISDLSVLTGKEIGMLPSMSVRVREAFPDPMGASYRLGRRIAGTHPKQLANKAAHPRNPEEEAMRAYYLRMFGSPTRAAAAYED